MRKRPTKSSSFHTKERHEHYGHLDFQTDIPLVMSSRLPAKTTNQAPQPEKRQRSRNKSELHTEKYVEELLGFKRANSRKKQTASKQIKKSEEKLKTFGATIQYNQPLPTKNFGTEYLQKQYFDTKPMDTFGYEKSATNRQRPQLPTNILSNLGSFKNKVNIMNAPTVPLMEQYERMSKQFGKSVMLKQPRAKSTTKERKPWDQELVPLKSQAALQHYAYLLTDDQKTQILQHSKIYYIGHKAIKRHHGMDVDYDNQQKQYVYSISDHIGYRYQILKFLGKGSYGQVFKVYDHKRREEAALKMIKNKKKFAKQSMIEINILTHIKEHDPHGISGIVKIRDFFVFRKHQCIIFQLLNNNLYELIKSQNYVGMDSDTIRKFAIQMLNSLKFLKEQKIIHCDLKPENVLLVQPQKSRIKIIDFGSSCFDNQIIYSYIQSRYYRAPEVTLGIQYNSMIDIWSLGCILAQLYLGTPIFPGDTEQEQMCYMLSCLGRPDPQLLRNAERRKVFFNDDFSVRGDLSEVELTPGFGRPLRQMIQPKDKLFVSFLQSLLKWDPKSRPSPKQALQHPWIIQGIPHEIKYLQSFFQQDLEYQKEMKKNLKVERGRSKQKQKGSNSNRKQKQVRQPKSASKSRQKSVKDRISQIYQNGNKKQNKSLPTKSKMNDIHAVSIKYGIQSKRKYPGKRIHDFKQFFTQK